MNLALVNRVNICSLNLDSTLLTPPQVSANPSCFQHLEFFNISRMKLCDQDAMNFDPKLQELSTSLSISSTSRWIR
ncbi:hypothetical protein RhiirB3_455350 [Rhizophagus irregularis]|nr:hypothetical protein RhiirB3_455350 [Rhizophagus irregularis]